MTLYDEIKKNFILPYAYKDWESYRHFITDYILRETNRVSLPLSFTANMPESALLPSLAIIGAGACNDIDLKKLVPHFSKITLLDYNQDAMITALDTYHLNNCSKIEHKTISLNGLNDSHYEDFCKQLQTYIQCNLTDDFHPTEFENYAITLVRNQLNSIKDYKVPLPENTYDYICCFGVHSQLQAMFSYIYHVFEVNLRNLHYIDTPDINTHFTKQLQEENDRFIPRFHDALISSAKQSIFLGLEKKRTDNDSPIEGAYQAMSDLEHRNLSTKEDYAMWPFLPSENIHYEMQIIKIML